MCAPVAIALGAVAVGSQVAGGIAGANAAKKQSKMEQAAAVKAFNQTFGDVEARRAEEIRAAVGERLQLQTISAQEKGVAQNVAAENGVTGQSVTSTQQVLDRALSLALGANLDNLAIVEKQLDRDIEGAAAGAQSRINGAKSMVPSTGAAIAGISGRSVSAALPFIPGLG